MPLACSTTQLSLYSLTTTSSPSPHRCSPSLHISCYVRYGLYPLLPCKMCFTMTVYPTVSQHLPIACGTARATCAFHMRTFPTYITWNHTHPASEWYTTPPNGFVPRVAPSHCTLSMRRITHSFIRHSASLSPTGVAIRMASNRRRKRRRRPPPLRPFAW